MLTQWSLSLGIFYSRRLKTRVYRVQRCVLQSLADKSRIKLAKQVQQVLQFKAPVI